jgi:hypothetical protein
LKKGKFIKPLSLKFVLIGTALTVVIAFLGGWAYQVFDSINNDSARAALYKIVVQKIDNYYSEHGKYPLKLKDLRISQFPEGGNKKTLKSYEYDSDGSTFILKWHQKHPDYTYTTKGEDGLIKHEGFK